jgi:hypothetical protein
MEASEDNSKRPDQAPEGLDLGPEPEKIESGFRVFLRNALRWLIIAVILLVLGGLAVFQFLYQPKVQQLSQANASLTEEQQQVEALQTEVASLTALEEENKSLQDELAAANRRVKILSALSDVNSARMALAMEDEEAARSSVANTARILTELAGLAGVEHRDQVEAMQARLKLALDEIERDAFAAQSDLGVLAAQLVQLDNQLMANP